MYVDVDFTNRVSIMEIDPELAETLSEALTLYLESLGLTAKTPAQKELKVILAQINEHHGLI